MEIKSNKQTLIVPIGVPGCGKSTFIKDIIDKQKSKGVLERDCLQAIEMDKIRSILPPVKNNEGLPQEYNNSVAKFSHEVLRTAMSYGLPLAYDATNLQERYLNNIISICEEYGYEPIFVPFEVERDELLKRNAERELSKQIDERIILSMCNSFDKLMSSEYWKKNERFTVVKPEEFEKVQPKIYKLDNKNVHIVGDIHGNFSNLEKFFEAHPYSKDDQYIFLGDYFDRGDNNGIIKMYNFINDNIDKENVVFIWGNHEDHLNNYAKNQQYWSGFNGTRKVLEEASVTKEEINSILSKMPNYYIFEKNGEKFFCCHGGLIKYPNNEHDLLLYKRNTFVRADFSPWLKPGGSKVAAL